MPRERNSHQSRPVARLPGTSFIGLSAFCLWIVLGAAFSFTFASCGGLVGTFIFLLILIWALLGPFALSFCFVELSGLLMQRGLIQMAERVARIGVFVDSSVLPLVNLLGMVDSPLAVLNLLNLASALHCQSRFKEAKEKLEVALDKAQGSLGWEHYLTQTVVGQLAGAYLSLGKFNEAEQYFKRAIAAKSNQLKDTKQVSDDPESLATVTGLAVDRFGMAGLMEKRQRFEQAEAQYKESIDMVEKNVSEDTDYLANHLNALGELYIKMGRIEEAEDPINRALAIRKEIFPADHIVLSSSYQTLGLFYLNRGELAICESYLDNALKTRRTFLGVDHPNLAETFCAMAELEVKKGNFKKAEEHLVKAIELLLKAFGDHYPDVAYVFECQSNLYERTGDHGKAQECKERAERIRQEFK